MITEIAQIDVKPGMEKDFEAGVAKAAPVFKRAKGCHGLTLEKPPSAYFQSNIFITTSGVCSAPTLVGAIGEMGAHNVLFSIDYPYESTAVACEFIETAPLDEATRALVCSGNARRLFKL